MVYYFTELSTKSAPKISPEGVIGEENDNSATALQKLTVKDLKTRLAKYGLPVSGTKGELIARLSTATMSTAQTSDAAPAPTPAVEAMEVEDVADAPQPEVIEQPPAAVSVPVMPLADRSNLWQSLATLSQMSAGWKAESAVKSPGQQPVKRSFRINLDELMEERENHSTAIDEEQ